jgi:hypothetical protein
MRLSRRSLKVGLAALGIAVALSVFFCQAALRFMGRIPIVRDELRPAQLIAVISGALPEIHYGVDLYKKGLGEKILFVGHYPVELSVNSKDPFDVVEKTWDEVAAGLAVNSGVPPDRLLYSTAMTSSTYERVEAVLRAARAEGQKSIIVVCDVLHSRRIGFTGRRLAAHGGTKWMVTPTPTSYYPPPYRYNPDAWWHSETFTADLFAEYFKLLYYWGRYAW